MLLGSLVVLATWLSRAWGAYVAHWRGSLPATVGAVVGIWFSLFLSGFGIDNDFSTPLGLPPVIFRLLVVAAFAIGFAAIGREWLDHHFPRE